MLWDEQRTTSGDFRRKGDDSSESSTADERQREFYEALAANYRQLVLNHEATRHYEAAEDFYIGEMETRRKQLRVERRGSLGAWVNVYTAYWALSSYGASVRHAVLVLVAFALVLFPIGFMLAGFAISKDAVPEGVTPPHPVAVDWDWLGWELIGWSAPTDAPSVSRWITDYWAALRFTLSIVSFQRDRFFVPTTDFGQIWLILAVFVLTGQLALVLFALRRRFKR